MLGVINGRAFDVALCTERRPRPYAYPIRRLADHTWQVAPVEYQPDGKGGFTSQRRAFMPGEPADFLTLTDCPADIDAELETI